MRQKGNKQIGRKRGRSNTHEIKVWFNDVTWRGGTVLQTYEYCSINNLSSVIGFQIAPCAINPGKFKPYPFLNLKFVHVSIWIMPGYESVSTKHFYCSFGSEQIKTCFDTVHYFVVFCLHSFDFCFCLINFCHILLCNLVV